MLSQATAERFAAVALGHVSREFPNKLDHVMGGAQDAKTPKALHPIFFGSFDWHSCVHSYWLLARVLREFPELSQAGEIEALFEAQFTARKVGQETEYARRPLSRGFERPYGWAWLLMLQAELCRHETPLGRRWAERLEALARVFAGRFTDFLPKATYPVRAGVHSNTAFALRLALDYAGACGDLALDSVCADKARGWYGHDRDCQAWEPSGDDFLSPALIEAECMRRVLKPAEFRRWFKAFLPRAAEREPRTLFEPAVVSDRSDGKIAHLDGLNLSRAWCWRGIASTLDLADPARKRALAAAEKHLDAALPHIAGDYMGEHWLATFALLALTA